MATGTNGIATVADVLSISGVKVSGSYTSTQCVKYSDIKQVIAIPPTTIDLVLDLGEFEDWLDGDDIHLQISFYQKGNTAGMIYTADLFADEQNYLCELTNMIAFPIAVGWPSYMKLTWVDGDLANGMHERLTVIINESTTHLDQFSSHSSREFNLSNYRYLNTLSNGAAIEVLSDISVTIHA